MPKYIEGKACIKCGCTTRYNSSIRRDGRVKIGECVQCRRTANNRKKALLMELSGGQTIYIGEKCARCGESDRYTSNGNCVKCQREDGAWRTRRLKRKYRGCRFFDGKFCQICAGTLRYVSNGNCVFCNSNASANVAPKHVEGKPCVRCGSTTRYNRNNGRQGSCVRCASVRKKKQKESGD